MTVRVSLARIAATQADVVAWLEQAQDAGEDWSEEHPTPAQPVRVTRDPIVARIDRVLRADPPGPSVDDVLGPRRPAPWSDLPHAAAIDRVIEQAWTMTDEQVRRLTNAWVATTLPRGAVWDAIQDAIEDAAWYAAWVASTPARRAAGEAVESALGDPASLATQALVMADLATPSGPLTPEHVETLLAPWISVMGDPREVPA